MVDSDDWVNAEAYAKILDTLRSFSQEGKELDMLVSNFVYEKVGEKKKRVMHYRHVLPQEKVFTWKDCHHFNKWNYILMHSVIFRTQMLKDSGLQLPEHTFYVDNLYVYESLKHVKNIFYIDVDFYRYYIGREDQSVNESVMISRMDQQVRVNKRMIDYYVENKEEIMKDKRLHQYMRSYLEVITIVTTVLCIRSGTEDHLNVRREIWQYMKGKDEKTFKRLRYGLMGTVMHLPGKTGRKISVGSYHICQKIFHFN